MTEPPTIGYTSSLFGHPAQVAPNSMFASTGYGPGVARIGATVGPPGGDPPPNGGGDPPGNFPLLRPTKRPFKEKLKNPNYRDGDELFGTPNDITSLDGFVLNVKESDAYNYKDRHNIKFAKLPIHTYDVHGFHWHNKSQLQTLDLTSNDALTKWVSVSANITGDLRKVMELFHNNSQGLFNLDKYIGSIYTSDACKKDSKFGSIISTYCLFCDNAQQAPRGRAIWAMITIMSQIDRLRNRTITLAHLYDIKLQGWSMAQMHQFIEKIRRMMLILRKEDVVYTSCF